MDDPCVSEARASWSQAFQAISPQDILATKQRNWDRAAIGEARRVLENSAQNPADRARLRSSYLYDVLTS